MLAVGGISRPAPGDTRGRAPTTGYGQSGAFGPKLMIEA